jgi:transcriptional regulator with XRE-family HTH domain
MPSPQGPLLPRRRLGAELRRLRGDRTLDEVAAETLISTSKLSRLENGQGIPQPRDIRDLINFYGADRATADRIRRWTAEGRRQAWWKEYSDAIRESADVQMDYESGASTIRTYMPMILPGLLQTKAYATRVIKTIYPHYPNERVEKLVEVRLRRQQTLLSGAEDAPRLLAVVDEAAIVRAMAMDPTAEGRVQLAHLREISRRRSISIRILPLRNGLHAGLLGPFTIYQFSDDIDRDIVHIETHFGDRYLEEQSSVLEYIRLFDSVTQRALDNSESRSLLTRLVDAPDPSEEKS